MFQPERLCTDKHVPWAWGVGDDVWAMFAASMNGDLGELSRMLANTPSLLHCSFSYRNPLHFAIRENQIEAARLLLAAGSSITYTGEKWHTSAPQIARDRGYVEMSKLIADHQFEHYGICEAGERIADAIKHRDVSATKALLKKDGPDVADGRGNKPIHWASLTRQFQVIDLCLQFGGDINATRPDGARALDLTNGDYWYRGWTNLDPQAMKNHWPVLGYLIANGADYDLTTACRIGDIARVKDLVENDPGAANRDARYSSWYSGFPLRSAAKAGYLHIVEFLIGQGADPNRPEHDLAPWGGTVFDSTQNGHTDVVKLLLNDGANPNQVVESSGSPLDVASTDELRNLLKQHGARYDWFSCIYNGYPEDLKQHVQEDPTVARDSELFMIPAARKDTEIVGIFEEADPRIWERMPAQLGDTPEVTSWMVDRGMNINQTNWLDTHALHGNFDVSVLNQWLALKVDLDLIDSEHQSTPLGMAARRGNFEQVIGLINAGADPHACGADFAHPIEWAKRGGHTEIVDRLRQC